MWSHPPLHSANEAIDRCSCFNAWVELVANQRAYRRLVKRALQGWAAMTTQMCFYSWRDEARNSKQERVAEKEVFCDSSTYVRACTRAYVRA
jgi:hypothetical protein